MSYQYVKQSNNVVFISSFKGDDIFSN